MIMKFLLTAIIISSVFILNYSGSYSQARIAVLPFENMDGNLELNVWCYDLRDSLSKALFALDPESEHYYIVPADSVEETIAELNLNPDNPQYKSDVIKAMKILKVKKVVSGNFIFRAENLLINGYIFDVRMRLHDPKHQARNIFKTEGKIFEAIPEIVKGIKGGLIKK